MAIPLRQISIVLFLSLICFFSVSSQTYAQTTYTEGFPDPLGGWTTRWFYQNTNAENYYTADDSASCNPDYRGNEPDGIWISDDRGCDNIIYHNPVRINFLNNFGDNATSFSIDVRACQTGTTLSIYDRNNTLVVTDSLTTDCTFSNHKSYTLNNGISAFEFNASGGQIEGYTAIDNVTITKQEVRAVPTLTEWGMIIFIVLAGLGSIYFLRRQRKAEI